MALKALGLLLITLLLSALLWQGLSQWSDNGQALAPVTGEYYLGEGWMATPTAAAAEAAPLSAPDAMPVLVLPGPTVAPTLPAANAGQPAPAATVDAAPDAFLVQTVQDNGIDPTGSYVVVNQNAQRMIVVDDGRVLRTIPVSTGDPDRGWFTPAWSGRIGQYWGTFTANGVSADEAWYLFQAGGSILIHSAPYTLAADGRKVYQGLDELGIFPASRGCIRIAPEDAVWFSAWQPYDKPIVILPWDGGAGREG